MRRAAIPIIVAGVMVLFNGVAFGCYWEPGCWLTGGGTKLDETTGMYLAEKGPKHSFGGNILPGCSYEAGGGGNWNHIVHGSGIHFKGLTIDEVICGCDPALGPCPSLSPVTGSNFIEAHGYGTISGIGPGKSKGPIDVEFFIHAEDLNEPGSEKANEANGGAYVDKYCIRVWELGNPAKQYLYLGGRSCDFYNSVGVPITSGNLQLHASSCP